MVHWPSWLPANRVAAIAAFLSGLGTAVAGLSAGLPTGAANTAAIISGLLIQAATVLHFLTGAQKSEALASRANVQVPFAQGGSVFTPFPSISQPQSAVQDAVSDAQWHQSHFAAEAPTPPEEPAA